MSQIDIRVNIHEFLGTDEEEVAQYTDDFPLSSGEQKFLLKSIEKTLTSSTFFVYDEDVDPEPGVPEFPRTFVVTISHIRSHD